MRTILLILLPLFSFAQLNIRAFGARESNADNSAFIQRAIDSAIRSGKSVIIPKGNYRVARPLVVASFTNNRYNPVFIRITGMSGFWDSGLGNDRSALVATFRNAPLLSIQKGKGCVIEGIAFYGQWKSPGSPYATTIEQYNDSTTRDSRYSPYAGLAIDAFRNILPPDGGYPTLTRFYRGVDDRGGSTGIIVRNCSFDGFTVGVVTSPNGYTQNCELMTFENIQVQRCKIAFAGSQAQEKTNRIINLGAWGAIHTVFAFNIYGEQTPGNWIIDGVNIAGDVHQVLYRISSGWFPMYIRNLYAETVFQFGYWYSKVGDGMSDFLIDFIEHDKLPKAHFEGGGISLTNGATRYYGAKLPVVFMNHKKDEGVVWKLNNVTNSEYMDMGQLFIQGYAHSALPDGVSNTDIIYTDTSVNTKGKVAMFMAGDNTWLGYKIGNKISFTLGKGVYKTAVK